MVAAGWWLPFTSNIALQIPWDEYFPPTVAFMAVFNTEEGVQLYGSLSKEDGVENTNGELALLADGSHSGISGGPVPIMFIIGLALRLLISHHNHTTIT